MLAGNDGHHLVIAQHPRNTMSYEQIVRTLGHNRSLAASRAPSAANAAANP